MTLREIIKGLCKENNISINKLETELGFAKGYVSKLDKSIPNSAKLQKIADYFNVTLDFLMTGQSSNEINKLTSKDERDIAKKLDKIMTDIDKNDDSPLYYNGEEIDNTSKLLLKDALESAMRQMKIINKEKYNPNKNKK